tara:strand:+ start:1342 stop:1872 length:531 start_codon:yes stop_codon:yes gene_type:complete
MSKTYKIIKDFMEPEFFKELKELLNDQNFNWHHHKKMTDDSTGDLGYFTHSFYNDHKINSNHYHKYILPILKKLNVSAVIQVRANLTPSVFYKNKKSDWHVDYNPIWPEYWTTDVSKTAIFYVNNCDGGTELKINNKIVFVKAEVNKMLIFDTNILHRGTDSKNADFRYIINFNYF